MTAKIALGLAWTCALVAGCQRKPTATVVSGPSEVQIKEMVSRAAGMPGTVYCRSVQAGRFPRPEDFPSRYLTLEVLSLTPQDAGAAKAAASPDFQMKSMIPPNACAVSDALTGGRKPINQVSYASVIWPDYITALKTERRGDEITGSAAFEAPDVYTGRVEFTLTPIRGGSGWQVTRLAIPGRNLALRLAEDGTWQAAYE